MARLVAGKHVEVCPKRGGFTIEMIAAYALYKSINAVFLYEKNHQKQ
jgi:hypothetical protein